MKRESASFQDRILISAPGWQISDSRSEEFILEEQWLESGEVAEVPGSTPSLAFLATVNR